MRWFFGAIGVLLSGTPPSRTHGGHNTNAIRTRTAPDPQSAKFPVARLEARAIIATDVSKRPRASLPPLGKRVRQLRDQRGLSQEDLAERLGFDVRTVQNVESKGRAGRETCKCIADAFDVPLAELISLRDESPEPSAASRAHQRTLEYLERFVETMRVRAEPFVPIRAVGKPGTISSNLERLVLSGQNAIVTGASGMGKSQSVLHFALGISSSSIVPVFARVLHFTGDLTSFFDSAVAPFTLLAFEALVDAVKAGGGSLLLLLDGFNEVPAPLQDALLAQVQALVLRAPARVVITSQSMPVLPPALSGQLLEAAPCNADERRAILEAHRNMSTRMRQWGS